jgi:hypothetical protein
MSLETIRPSLARSRATLVASSGVAVALVVIALLQPTTGAATGVGGLAGAAALVALGVWLHWRNARIRFGEGRVERTNLLGATTVVADSSVATVLVVLQLDGAAARPVPGLFLFDADGATLLRMRGEAWDVESMAALGAALPVAAIVIAEPITADALRRRFPGAVEPWEVHPARYSLAVGAIVVAVIAAGTLVR